MAKEYNIVIDQGSDFYLDIDYTDASGVAFPLTGYTAKMQLRENTDSATATVTLESLKATITNVSASSGTVTYTAANSFSANQKVTITGVNPTAYNLISATVASANSTTFTVTNAATGSYLSGGTASSGITITPSLGNLLVRITSVQTALLTSKQYVYDLKITSADGIVTRLLQGIAEVDDQVTRA